MRTGIGYDLHRLVRGKKLILGGIHIPYKKGEKAHSDGDVLLHAITDALLGATGIGDIGEFFPPDDIKWKNANSAILLKTVWSKIKREGWIFENLDCVILIEEPKILPFRNEIRSSIANILDVEYERIFLKAKTGEGLGIIGRGKAVAVICTVLLHEPIRA